MEAPTRGEVLRRIVERADLELFTDRVLDSFWEQPAFQQLRPSRDDTRAWVRWNLDLVIRWLIEGEPPNQAILRVLNTAEVNSLLKNRVSDRSSVLFLSGTPVPLTVWKGVPYSRKSAQITPKWCGIFVVGKCNLVG